jgi:cellobiose-specific phosphotransferase system component IIA
MLQCSRCPASPVRGDRLRFEEILKAHKELFKELVRERDEARQERDEGIKALERQKELVKLLHKAEEDDSEGEGEDFEVVTSAKFLWQLRRRVRKRDRASKELQKAHEELQKAHEELQKAQVKQQIQKTQMEGTLLRVIYRRDREEEILKALLGDAIQERDESIKALEFQKENEIQKAHEELVRGHKQDQFMQIEFKKLKKRKRASEEED